MGPSSTAPRAPDAPLPSPSIARSFELPPAMDFEWLVTRGIALAQQLSGDEWTDFNEHDPGVTILQALCYAIADLAYRADHPIADILLGAAANPGEAAARQAIVPGDIALSAAPLTTDDYRQLLYDAITGLQNAWLLPIDDRVGGRADKPAGALGGVYRVLVERIHLPPGDASTSESPEAICGAAAAVLHARRNLGEDFETPREMPEVGIKLVGELDIGSEESPEDIVAAVQYAVQTHLVRPPHVTPSDALLDNGLEPDVVFEGPRLSLGTVTLEPYEWTSDLPAPEQFLAAIRSVPGVRRVRDLSLVVIPPGPDAFTPRTEVQLELSAHGAQWVEASRSGDPTIDVVPDGPWIPRILDWETPVASPEGEAPPRLVVIRDGVRGELRAEWIQSGLRHIRERWRQTEQHSATRMLEQEYVRLPNARDRALSHYRSVQHFLPPAYGVGPGGVPDLTTWRRAESPEPVTATQRERQALQLKSYLLLCEQLLADHLAQLANVGTLFSIEHNADASGASPVSTYFTQPLMHSPPHDDDVPDIERVLRDAGPVARDAATRAADRRRREAMLDHLLARFGESFDNATLERVIDSERQLLTEGDAPRAAPDGAERRMARKRAFLHGLLLRDGQSLGRDRGIGIDYRSGALGDYTPQHAAAGRAASERVLLPRRTPIERRIAALSGFDQRRLHVVEHVLLRPRVSGAPHLRYLMDHQGEQRLLRLWFAHASWEDKIHEALGTFEELELRESVGDRSHWGGDWLALHATSGDVLVEIDAGVSTLAAARDVLRALEGTVRGADAADAPHLQAPTPVDPYRLSVVYMRPGSVEADQLIERMARENCPAHLVPTCVSLADDTAMQRFESLYSAWLQAWQPGQEDEEDGARPTPRDGIARVWPAPDAQLDIIDRAAWALHEFLVARHRDAQSVRRARRAGTSG